MKFGLNNSVVEKINIVFSYHPQINEVIIYGSRAKGNFKPGSDLDLVFKGNQLTSNDLHKIAQQLDELYLPYKFDLSLYDHIQNPDLIEHIQRVGKVFYPSY